MKNFTIELSAAEFGKNTKATIGENDVKVMFEGTTFDEFQTKLIGIVTSEKMHAKVLNSRGKEIMFMRFSPSCKEGVCCGWTNTRRLNGFIKSFVA